VLQDLGAMSCQHDYLGLDRERDIGTCFFSVIKREKRKKKKWEKERHLPSTFPCRWGRVVGRAVFFGEGRTHTSRRGITFAALGEGENGGRSCGKKLCLSTAAEREGEGGERKWAWGDVAGACSRPLCPREPSKKRGKGERAIAPSDLIPLLSWRGEGIGEEKGKGCERTAQC